MSRSSELFEASKTLIPGGVNSPVRAFAAVEGDPVFIQRGEGHHLIDVDDNRYVDLVGSWGPLILGHAHPAVVQAVNDAMSRGASFGAPTEAELRFAEDLVERVPGLEMVRLCSSGTEATMHAVRLARGFTGRDAVIKLDGCYHGAHDTVLVAAGSGVATFAAPGSPGIVAPSTLTAPFNDLHAVEEHFVTTPIAAVILEAVPGNMGCIPPQPGYLEGLRRLCNQHGALLIIDEVMTGFRLARGGACERFGITPDLVALGKIIGGGLPLAAFGGRRDVMQRLSPLGPVYQAGTLSGNPLAVAAGRATLAQLTPEAYARLEVLGERLEAGLDLQGTSLNRVGSMFTIFFRSSPPLDMADVKQCDFDRFGRFHRAALRRGVYLPCSQYEAAFLPLSLTDDEVDKLATQLSEAIRESA